MLLYATDTDLQTWLEDTPDIDNAPALLRQASILVGAACRNDLYDTEPNGAPSDDTLVEAMRDATCAQVEYWITAGINATAGGGGIAVAKIERTLDGATVKYDTTAIVAAAQSATDSLTCLVPAALTILRNAGLASGWV